MQRDMHWNEGIHNKTQVKHKWLRKKPQNIHNITNILCGIMNCNSQRKTQAQGKKRTLPQLQTSKQIQDQKTQQPNPISDYGRKGRATHKHNTVGSSDGWRFVTGGKPSAPGCTQHTRNGCIQNKGTVSGNIETNTETERFEDTQMSVG